ncbi:hypothetical protein RB594_001033 [Gaeumannomyces avenae]
MSTPSWTGTWPRRRRRLRVMVMVTAAAVAKGRRRSRAGWRGRADRAALRGQIINVLGAGRDTTACLLSWTFYILVRHPSILAKLRTEIATNPIPPPDLRRADLKAMPLPAGRAPRGAAPVPARRPSTPAPRRATRVLPAGGGLNRGQPLLVPRGSVVAFDAYALHRRADLYGMDAEVFRPERWFDNDDDEGGGGGGMSLLHDPLARSYGYLPFGGGPRVCIGMDFALTEAAYAVVCILDRFPAIALPEGEKVEPLGSEKQTMAVLLRITDGCNVRLG